MSRLAFFSSKEVEWSDTRAYMDGARVVKLRGVEYTIEQEKEQLYAEGSDAIGIQQGNKKVSGTITMLVGALTDLNTAAIALGGNTALDLQFDMVIQWRGSSDGTRALHLDTLQGVQLTKLTKNMKQNDKLMEVQIPFIAIGILYQ